MSEEKQDGLGQEPEAINHEPSATQQDPDNTFSAEYVEKLRKENAKWRTQLRKMEDREKQLTDLLGIDVPTSGDAGEQPDVVALLKQQTEDTRAKLDQLLEDNKAKELQILKTNVANDLSLPASLVKFVSGDTEDAIRASAQELLDAMPKPEEQPTPPRRGGVTAVPGGQPAEETRDQKLNRIYGRSYNS